MGIVQVLQERPGQLLSFDQGADVNTILASASVNERKLKGLKAILRGPDARMSRGAVIARTQSSQCALFTPAHLLLLEICAVPDSYKFAWVGVVSACPFSSIRVRG